MEGSPSALALRLKVENRQITEIETLVIRSTATQAAGTRRRSRCSRGSRIYGAAVNLERIGTPNKLFLETVPAAERMSREDLIKTANMYFSGMQKNDGKGDYPFADDCNRIENGDRLHQRRRAAASKGPIRRRPPIILGKWSCMEQFESGLLHFVSAFATAVMWPWIQSAAWSSAFAFFDHARANSARSRRPRPNRHRRPDAAVDLGTGGDVQARKRQDPPDRGDPGPRAYGMNSGWSNWEDGMSSAARDVTKSSGR